MFKRESDIGRRRSHIWPQSFVMASRLLPRFCKILHEKTAVMRSGIMSQWFSKATDIHLLSLSQPPPPPPHCPPMSAVPRVSGKEVAAAAVVVLRPGGHVTAAASWWGGGWAPALPAPPPPATINVFSLSARRPGPKQCTRPWLKNLPRARTPFKWKVVLIWFWFCNVLGVKLMEWIC